MIERLMDKEVPCRDPAYNSVSAYAAALRQQLRDQLLPEGQEKLEALADAYMKQETAVLREAFSDGFCAAISLALEYLQRK